MALLLAAAASSHDAAAAAPEFVVIVNKQNHLKELSKGKLKTAFLRKISRWPWGAEIHPVDLPEGSPIRREFDREVLNTTSAELEVYWIDQKATRNIDPPAVAGGIEAAKAAVATYPGAIGYIPLMAVDGTVKMLELVP